VEEQTPKSGEGVKRTFGPRVEIALAAYATFIAIVHLYFLAFDPADPYLFRGIHVASVGVIVFLRYPAWKSARRIGVSDVLLILMGLAVCGYLFLEFPDIQFRRVLPNDMDMIMGTAILIVTLELGRRAAGWALPILGMVTVAYALISDLPGMLAHPSFSYNRVAGFILSNEGVFGLTTAISASYVALFILFGALIDVSGAGDFLIRLSSGLTGWARGGPAKIALMASGLFGMVSGASSANVVTTGTFTIGAVESVASTGGQLMPPVMGAGAFIMAEIIGVPYGDVAAAAIIPALLYYVSLYFMVAAFWALSLLWLCAAIRPETRMGPKKIASALALGAERLVAVMPSCAVAGIIVGMLNLTGLGLKIGGFLVALAGGSLLAALVLTMVLSIILGMGLPSVPAYIVAATVTAPALIELGVPELASHMFVFYFAALSAVTPPVAIAAYAAAGIAQAPPHKVGYLAVRLGIVAFLVPYFFVYGPALLGQGSALTIALVTVTATLGVIALSVAVSGVGFRGPILWFERLMLVAGALSLIMPGLWTDLGGLVLVGPLLILRVFRGRQEGTTSPSSVESAT
jgi:TRAP-type uncharacterized transport system fused permease subunit